MTIRNSQLVRGLICAALALFLANASFASTELSDPIVLQRRISYLIEDCKFTEAQNVISDSMRAGDAAFAMKVKKIELFYMPKTKLTPAAEKMLQSAHASFLAFDFEKFLALSKECVREYPQSEYARIMLSRSYYWEVKDGATVSEAFKAVELAPDNLAALGNLGRCCMYAHRKNDAVKAFHAIEQIDPRNQPAAQFFAMLDAAAGDIRAIPMIDRRLAKKELEEEIRNSQSAQPRNGAEH